ncbi:hypothetical protein CXB51_017399 [Gossypium anomalum]|uniref:Uncharacterized protein n=1 Tax=Gossypium anomalum TaxID=47600 RepID=A0A8J5Z6A2_9ROSI|nr:hypothetical protein CXB51_017399 [Gossypium anomalum]
MGDYGIRMDFLVPKNTCITTSGSNTVEHYTPAIESSSKTGISCKGLEGEEIEQKDGAQCQSKKAKFIPVLVQSIELFFQLR